MRTGTSTAFLGSRRFPISTVPSAGYPTGKAREWARNRVYKETFWMACDSTEQLRAEYGPFHTRAEAEREAGKLGFDYILRYEHVIGENDDIKEVRCIFIELQPQRSLPLAPAKLHTRCASCGESAVHERGWQ